MQAGELRHNVQILQPPNLSTGAYGKQNPNLTDFVNFGTPIWAKIEPISSREFDFAMNFAETVSHRVKIRYLSGITPSMIVKYGSRYFSIDGVLNFEERNIFQFLYCTEMVG